MGLRDLLAVVLGARAADTWREHGQAVHELKTRNAELQARVAYSQSPEGWAEIQAKVAEEDRQATLEMLMLWGRVPPANRVRPDLRTGDAPDDTEMGAERGIQALIEEVGYLYAAALASGSWSRWRQALSWRTKRETEDDPFLKESAFQAYTEWVREFRAEGDSLLERLFRAGSADTLTSNSTMEWAREGLGLGEPRPFSESD